MNYPKSVLELVVAYGDKETIKELVTSTQNPLSILIKDLPDYLSFIEGIAIPNGWVWADGDPFEFNEPDIMSALDNSPYGLMIELEANYAEGVGWVYGELDQLEYSFMQEYENHVTAKGVLEKLDEIRSIGGSTMINVKKGDYVVKWRSYSSDGDLSLGDVCKVIKDIVEFPEGYYNFPVGGLLNIDTSIHTNEAYNVFDFRKAIELVPETLDGEISDREELIELYAEYQNATKELAKSQKLVEELEKVVESTKEDILKFLS